MSEHPPVAGRYYPQAGPGFVTLDVSALVDNNVHDLLDALMSDEFFEDFIALSSAPAIGHDGHAPDRLAFEELKNALFARLATRASMTGRQARVVGQAVYALGVELSADEDVTASRELHGRTS